MRRPFVAEEIDSLLEMEEVEMMNGRTRSIVQRVVTQAGGIEPRNLIDPRIDVGAQRAILRMARGTPRQRVDALGLLAAVKSGRLRGIFGDDLRAAAQLAAQRGTVRWELVPRGRDAALIRSPVIGRPPTIIFREQVRSAPSRLDPALQSAFRAFRKAIGRGMTLSAASAAVNPFLCALLCAACAAAILDGVPGDEVVPCSLCLNVCVRGSG